MKVLTISELQRIITERKCNKYVGIEFYIVDDVKEKIVCKMKFEKLDIKRIVTKKTYTL